MVLANSWAAAWRDRTAVRVATHALFKPAGCLDCGSVEPLVRLAAERLLLHRDLVLAVPESAVVDTGNRKVVYCERMPGLFDGVEVTLGRRCGDLAALHCPADRDDDARRADGA